MIEVILDASQLELFESCPRKWYYSQVLNLTTISPYSPFDIGSYYHSVIAHYYTMLKRTKSLSEALRSACDFAAQDTLLKKYHINDPDERIFHRRRLMDYINYYAHEDESLEIIAIESGFSYLLYEDENCRYILEGLIDLITINGPLGLIVMDHKTQSRKDDRWEFNHQVCNYLNFTKADYFVYNYIGLQQNLPKDGFRRVIYKPPEGMLEQWLKEVLRTFDEMYNYVAAHGIPELREFPRRRAACDSSKYGLCQYHKLCSIPDNSRFQNAVLSAYKTKEQWRAWS